MATEFYPTASIIADSLNTVTGDRLTTMVCKFHRLILAQFNKHRVFSQNSSSSRAIPVEKMIQKVIEDNVYPLHFGKNKKGMQATEEIADIETARRYWDLGREDAIQRAKLMSELGIHKQVANRFLELYSTVTVIVSSTEWENFFKQRCHPDAQPEIKALADEMVKARNASKAKLLNPGVWHLPFIQDAEYDDHLDEELLQISVGRCARVSYLSHNGVRDVQEDINLHDRLLSSKPPHLSPFEHQAIASQESKSYANFTGFQSYRNILENSGK